MTATAKYFSDIEGTVELSDIQPMDNAEFAKRFGEVKALRCGSFSKIVGRAADGRLLPATRRIFYKSRPSLHVCNAKCMGGKPNGTCECSCGGKNHGAGMFTSLLAAA